MNNPYFIKYISKIRILLKGNQKKKCCALVSPQRKALLEWELLDFSRILIGVSLGIMFLISSVLSFGFRLESSEKCTPSVFEYKEGWLGGDAAYSIPFSDGKVLWLFGDTFVGTHDQTSRSGSKMVSNSAAVSSCRNGRFEIKYYWKSMFSSDPKPFINSDSKEFVFWPMNGFEYKKRVYVVMAKVSIKPNGGLFGFEYNGAILARINNPEASPLEWKIDKLNLLPFPGIIFGNSVVSHEGYFYFYASTASSDHSLMLMRLSKENVDDPRSSLEYFSKKSLWKPGFDMKDAFIVLQKGAPELSVRFQEKHQKWIMISNDLSIPSHDVVVRTADKIEGPWSSPRILFHFPTSRDLDTYCYAAREHPEFESLDSKTIVITYVCNSLVWAKQVENMSIYRPEVVVLPIQP